MDTLGLQTLPNGAKQWMCTGIMFQESEVGIKHIIDGTSKTYLIGERYCGHHELPARHIADGTLIHGGDNWGWAHGFDDDNTRSGLNVPLVDYPNFNAGDDIR